MTEPWVSDELTAIHVDEFLPYPPERVWAALTDPASLARWLMPNDFVAAVGHRFTFTTDPVPGADFDGIVHCEVLELEPPRRLRISWAGGGHGMRTTVTWRLEGEGRGTRLLLDHEGFDPDHPAQQAARHIMGGGWRSHLMRRLTEELAAV